MIQDKYFQDDRNISRIFSLTYHLFGIPRVENRIILQLVGDKTRGLFIHHSLGCDPSTDLCSGASLSWCGVKWPSPSTPISWGIWNLETEYIPGHAATSVQSRFLVIVYNFF